MGRTKNQQNLPFETKLIVENLMDSCLFFFFFWLVQLLFYLLQSTIPSLALENSPTSSHVLCLGV